MAAVERCQVSHHAGIVLVNEQLEFKYTFSDTFNSSKYTQIMGFSDILYIFSISNQLMCTVIWDLRASD